MGRARAKGLGWEAIIIIIIVIHFLGWAAVHEGHQLLCVLISLAIIMIDRLTSMV